MEFPRELPKDLQTVQLPSDEYDDELPSFNFENVFDLSDQTSENLESNQANKVFITCLLFYCFLLNKLKKVNLR